MSVPSARGLQKESPPNETLDVPKFPVGPAALPMGPRCGPWGPCPEPSPAPVPSPPMVPPALPPWRACGVQCPPEGHPPGACQDGSQFFKVLPGSHPLVPAGVHRQARPRLRSNTIDQSVTPRSPSPARTLSNSLGKSQNHLTRACASPNPQRLLPPFRTRHTSHQRAGPPPEFLNSESGALGPLMKPGARLRPRPTPSPPRFASHAGLGFFLVFSSHCHLREQCY